MASTRSSDETALQPTRQTADQAVESRVNALLKRMTLEEKLEQIQLLPDFMVTDNRGKFVVERGRIDVYAGNSSSADMKQSFTVTG